MENVAVHNQLNGFTADSNTHDGVLLVNKAGFNEISDFIGNLYVANFGPPNPGPNRYPNEGYVTIYTSGTTGNVAPIGEIYSGSPAPVDAQDCPAVGESVNASIRLSLLDYSIV
jgi:hypothetical protein